MVFAGLCSLVNYVSASVVLEHLLSLEDIVLVNTSAVSKGSQVFTGQHVHGGIVIHSVQMRPLLTDVLSI